MLSVLTLCLLGTSAVLCKAPIRWKKARAGGTLSVQFACGSFVGRLGGRRLSTTTGLVRTTERQSGPAFLLQLAWVDARLGTLGAAAPTAVDGGSGGFERVTHGDDELASMATELEPGGN
eukprot:SAG11_NODE_913_length_6579_cov_3.562963_5_plen_120_part_00